jgi:hypothetical protein
MYPVGTGSAALQRRIRRGQTSAKAAEVFDLSGFGDFLPAPYCAGGYTNYGIALADG